MVGVGRFFVLGLFVLKKKNQSVSIVSDPRPAHLSDGTEIQCLTVTALVDSMFT